MAYGENGKKWLVNCLLDSASEKSLIRTDVTDELQLRGTLSVVTVRGVHGLSARVRCHVLGSLAASLLGGSGPASNQEMHQSLHHLPEARRSSILSIDERPVA
ncbi:hypothetical protein T10_4340 [Trichinella papuae]|uniref:Peptidase A2 domain-containing protein n=1 Tax=Trichinella papuae TaxID=268474 RepID=A0A0V1M2V1_9BILA|nr:hypothetical protein T10_4340 [Trichinella papuae]